MRVLKVTDSNLQQKVDSLIERAEDLKRKEIYNNLCEKHHQLVMKHWEDKYAYNLLNEHFKQITQDISDSSNIALKKAAH